MSLELVRFQVLGKCEPQGSARAFVPTGKNGQPIRRPDGSIVVNITSDNPALKAWRKKIAAAAEAAWDQPPLEGVSLMVEALFFLKRPEGHYRTGRYAHLLKDDAPAAPLVIPDHDKLLRAALDGLTGIVYKDDALVTCSIPDKHYAVPTEHGDGRGMILTVLQRPAQTALDLPEEQRQRYLPGHQLALA